jgi:hypothetical protein
MAHCFLDGLLVRSSGHVVAAKRVAQNMGVRDETSRLPFAPEAALCYNPSKPVSWAIQE